MCVATLATHPTQQHSFMPHQLVEYTSGMSTAVCVHAQRTNPLYGCAQRGPRPPPKLHTSFASVLCDTLC
jgi:hypothetical protein